MPYRDRDDHLRTFLLNIHKFLQPQQLDYGIYFGKKYKSEMLAREPFSLIAFFNSPDF